jgi:hypothetical protein
VFFHRSRPADTHLFLEEEAALDDEHFLDNRNNDDPVLFSDGGHRLDLLADVDAADLRRLICEHLVDQLLALVRDPRDLNPAGFNRLLRDRNLFRREGNERLGGLVVGPKIHRRSAAIAAWRAHALAR